MNNVCFPQVKKRIVEFLAVRKLRNDCKGPILCLNGPPGVGKTSIVQSIALALKLPFQKVALGGITDPHELRGHRRTYVAALPGFILQGIKNAKVKNPVFLLDEIDKIKDCSAGNPTAALLEILDPEQNSTFCDSFLDYPFDLSKVLFIATSNLISTIPTALIDRLEVIDIPGYTEDEKMNIAKLYLIKKEIKANGLEELRDGITIPEPILLKIIRQYTREAGVRNLSRAIASILRTITVAHCHNKEQALKSKHDITDQIAIKLDISEETVLKVLGPPKYKQDLLDNRVGRPGVAVGLAVSSWGGSVLVIETQFISGKDTLKLTGSLGDVMKESVEVAHGWVASHLIKRNLASPSDAQKSLHVHFPEGATPKDGPSAGVAIVCCLVSLFTGKPLHRDVAMTGEISLHGLVLPVGGIKAKILAAAQFGIKTIYMPLLNSKDLKDVPANVKEEIRIVLVSRVEEVIKEAFVSDPFSSTAESLALASKL